jgi:hypothetical protein
MRGVARMTLAPVGATGISDANHSELSAGTTQVKAFPDRGMPEQQLNLFEFPAGFAAELNLLRNIDRP